MRALTKIFRARASEHQCDFCEQFEQRPNFSSPFKLNGTFRYPSPRAGKWKQLKFFAIKQGVILFHTGSE